MSCIRYGEGGKGIADGGCSVSSIEDLRVFGIQRAIIESYGLVGMSVAVEMSYWLGEHGSCAVGEREAPVQISNDKDFDLFTSARKVDKYINVFVTFKEEIDGKIHFLRPMGNLLKSKEVASSNEMQVGSTSADVHTRNEVNDGETDLTEDEIILMGVAEIEAVYASNGFGMREVDGTACEVQNKVDTTEDAALGEGEDDDDEDYDYNLWHDFVGRNCEWDDDKDEDGGVGGGGRTNVTYGGVRGEVVTKTRSGRTNPSSNKGSGSSTNKQRTANPPSTFEDYVDEGRDYIGSSRISMENIEEASNNLGVKSSDQVADTENHSDPNQEEDPSLDNSSQMLVLQTPPKPFNMHTREVDDSDDFVGQVPQCVSSRPTHDTSDGEDEDDDFVEPVPMCVSVDQTHETLVGEDEDDDFIEPVPQSRSREEDARRRREKDKADDESLMKSVRAVELYGFEDVEASSNNEAVNDYTVDDIDFTLADADMYTGKLFSSKQEFKISLHIYALKQVFRQRKISKMSGEIPPAVDELMENNLEDARAQGKMTVAKYKRFFYSLPIVGERTEQQLILLAKAGLKEEIRDGLETEEFATLEALFEEAEEVEEGLKETPPSSPGKRRRTSPDHRSSKRARKAEKKGDPEDEGFGYPGEGDTGLKDDEEGDYWEWMQMETDVDDDASDRTDDTLGSGQFRMDNYPDSSGTDSSTSDSD
ncbi:hypothetical protein HID58_092755 [Brassica napus]|uniref:Uncharacterized protein n=1 Tax=Brassica napus TaxID=3708 RepID=A0ABQ7XDN7_BRANA|nr:hypothetical protein HID58_092755 [Brassica napus]